MAEIKHNPEPAPTNEEGQAILANQISKDSQNTRGQLDDALRMMLTEADCKRLWGLMQNVGSETQKNWIVRQESKKSGLPPEVILRDVRMFTKNQIRQREKGQLRHYHRTSMDNLRLIAKSGRMLSRSKLQKLYPEIKLPGWSSSDDVMFTRDKYSMEGKLIMPGLDRKDSVGASGHAAILVFKSTIMNQDDYDAIRMYPTISDMRVADHCECILGETMEDVNRIRQTIAGTDLQNIPVLLRSNWEKR